MNLLTRDRSTSAPVCARARATAIVIDARQGGCAIARSLAEHGFAVCLGHAPLDAGAAAATIAAIVATGGHALAVEIDDIDGTAAAHAFERAEEVFGGIDVLVDNGAANVPARGAEDELFDRYFGVALRGMTDTVREAAPRLRHGGSIVHLSGACSDEAARTQAWMTPHAALEWLTRTFAAELAHHGIRINVIAPSAECSEPVIAEAIALLLGADGSGCNGQVFDVGATALCALGVAA